MFQNFSSNDEFDLEDEFDLDTKTSSISDNDFIEKGHTPFGCVLSGGRYVFCDYFGRIGESSFQEGLYLDFGNNDIVYYNGERMEKPLKVLYDTEE